MSIEDDFNLIDNENVKDQLSTIENKLTSLQQKLNHPQEPEKFELIDRTDLKNKISHLTSNLIENNFTIIKKYLQSKSNPNTIPIQETCVRLLTLCVQQNFEHAKQISSEFNYFNETKTWLEKFLLLKKSDLREMSVEFILSFLKYTQPPFNSQENLILIKKVFLKSQDTKSQLTLINCLFSHLTSDSKDTLNYFFKQILYGIVRNPGFSKSEKIKIFSDQILNRITKLFDYESVEDKDEIQEITNQFLKCLFTSTKFGISFYDKTLGLKSDKNLNHLIFNQLIALDFNRLYTKVKDLLLTTLRVCPDLVQKFIKVKLKQLGSDTKIFYEFLTEFFGQQSKHLGTFIRFLVGNEDDTFLLDLILATSLPMGLNFQKGDLNIELLTSCLNCVKNWKCLITTDKHESLRLILEKSDSFETRLNLELLSKYLPKFEQLSSVKNFDLITAYVSIFQESLNLIDLEQIECDLAQDLDLNQAKKYLKFLQCLYEIKYRNNFELINEKSRKIFIKNLQALISIPNLYPELVEMFKVLLRPSETIRFDDDFMYLFLREVKQNKFDGYRIFFDKFLSYKQRSLMLLDEESTVELNDFVNSIQRSDEYLYNTRILREGEQVEHSESVRGLVGKKSVINGEKFKIKSLSEAYMFHVRGLLDFESINLDVKLFNWSIRSRLLGFLLNQVINKADGFDEDKDFDIILTNLDNTFQTINEISKNSDLTDNQTEKLKHILTTILNNRTLVEHSFTNERLSKFVLESLQTVHLNKSKLIEPFINEYVKNEKTDSFILQIELSKSQFDLILNKLIHKYDLTKSEIKINKKFFKIFTSFLIKNESILIDSVGLKFLDKINKFNGKMDNFISSLRLIFLAIKSDETLLDDVLTKFLYNCKNFEPNLFDLQLVLIESDRVKEIIDTSVSKMSPVKPTQSLSSSVPDLICEYKHTMGERDTQILSKLKTIDPSLNCLMFSRMSRLGKSNDLDQKQIKLNDFITLKLDGEILLKTIRNFPVNRKLDEMDKIEVFCDKIYDPVYIIPNLYDLLDYGNIVDVLQFIQTNCLSLLLSSLSSHCSKLRSLAYGSIYRFISHLENSRVYCKNVLIYMFTLLRNSIHKENQRLSTVITLFLAESIMVIIEPGTCLYKPLISFLLIKPTLDLTNVPEFYKLFNSSSMEYKTERKWILGILANGCRSSLEYRLYEKRFIYRQLMSIYDSKISDNEIRHLILDVLLKTCESKFSLIDLIKRHYILIWLTSVFESSTNDLELFLKLVKLYTIVWDQLSKGEKQLPLIFLNQMLVLMKIVKTKLGDDDTKFERLFESDVDRDQKSVIENFFRVNDELIRSIEVYDFSLSLRTEKKNITQMIEMSRVKVLNGEIKNYGEFLSFVQGGGIENGKRCSDDDFVKPKKIKIK